jgi:hypothetical protein
MTIPMEHIRCRPVSFQFSIPITTTTSTDTTTTVETFEWRRAPRNCFETRGIRKKTLPVMESGDERPPEEKHVHYPSGSVLVRLGGARCPPGFDTPLGFTHQGEEIVASFTDSRDRKAWYYFQFWGAGATGELGEVFTHVAVMSGMAVWQDEGEERFMRQKGEEVWHGVAPPAMSTPTRRGDWPGSKYARGLGFYAIPGIGTWVAVPRK